MNITGDTSLFNTAGAFAFGGSFGLDTAGNESAQATDGIFSFDSTVSQGEIIRWMQYIDTTAGSADEACTLFGVRPTGSPAGSDNDNYAVCLELFLTDRMTLVRDAESTDTFGGVVELASTTVSYTTGWYEVEVDWQVGGDIDVALYTDTGNARSHDFGFRQHLYNWRNWIHVLGFNGAGDSYISRPRTDSRPQVFFGAEQSDGGASWRADQNIPAGGYAFGDVARLRLAIENSGLDIENQNFQLEFAPKLTAPSCEAVPAGNFGAVPNVASCGSSAICMTTSANISDGDPTTDHIVTDGGEFVAGEVVSNSSNQTSNLDVNQGQYTELEYVLSLTVNATNDAYCFRVTDSGDSLDSYSVLPELTLAFDPVLTGVTLNNGMDINLTPGTTTLVYATGTVTDFNGFADLTAATATIYRSGAGAACSPDDNNCYISTSTGQCQFTNCSGSSCTLSCSADIAFHAEPTDIGTFAGEEWFAYLEVEDTAGGFDLDSSLGVEMLTLRALDVTETINYGSLDVSQDTDTFNPSSDIFNTGNEAIDVEIAGTDMTDGLASVIPANQQLVATSTFTYSACTICSNLTAVGETFELDLAKPVASSPLLQDSVYWGIEIPFGTASNPHSGNNTFSAVAD